jgi:hypothetical protein
MRTPIAKEAVMLDDIDKLVLVLAYSKLEKILWNSRIAGKTVCELLCSVRPDLAPNEAPNRLSRLVSQGLLEKDVLRSTGRMYAPTSKGRKMYRELTAA